MLDQENHIAISRMVMLQLAQIQAIHLQITSWDENVEREAHLVQSPNPIRKVQRICTLAISPRETQLALHRGIWSSEVIWIVIHRGF